MPATRKAVEELFDSDAYKLTEYDERRPLLYSIVARLQLLPQSPNSDKAIDLLEKEIADCEEAERLEQ